MNETHVGMDKRGTTNRRAVERLYLPQPGQRTRTPVDVGVISIREAPGIRRTIGVVIATPA
jgi:hypothetical protein